MSKKMTAQHDDGLWVVSEVETHRWWTTTNDTEDALITSDAGRIVKSTSALGTRIRAAVTAAKN